MSCELDLGELTGSVLVFGGPYSNFQATSAMRAIATAKGISASQVICTGDVVAYCAQPEETVSLIRSWGVPVVQGNCEQSVGDNSEDCGCGFEEGSACSVLSNSWFSYTQANVSEQSRAWMRSLPTRLSFRLAGKRFVCVHGDATRNNAFVFKSQPWCTKREQIEALCADAVIGGHCGLPFGELFCEGSRSNAWLNAGVIGMPANDATTSTWYMLLEPEEQGVRVSWERLSYDYTSAQGQMFKAGLPEEYATSLESGLWPSNDVLPAAEKKTIGHRLSPEPLFLS